MPPIDPGQSSDESESQLGADPQSDLSATYLSSSSDTATNRAPDVKPASTDDVAFRVGRRLARYEITRLLGVGGMGVVYQERIALERQRNDREPSLS